MKNQSYLRLSVIVVIALFVAVYDDYDDDDYVCLYVPPQHLDFWIDFNEWIVYRFVIK